MNKAYVLVGMSFGDEGKGTFGDYLTFDQNIKQLIRYNGGSQASHTVITPDNQIHKFSQLSSGMLLDGTKTYLSKNTVINPHNLVEESKILARKINFSVEKIMERVYIDENCYIVTPYHKLINKLRELSKAYVRRGSVGTGVSEVMRLLHDEDLGIQMKYLNPKYKDVLKEKLIDLYYFTNMFLTQNKPFIDSELFNKELDQKEIYFLTDFTQRNKMLNYYTDLIRNYNFNVISDFDEFYKDDDNAIFEASQGVLLDYQYGIKPNTTLLDTTNKYALEILEDKNSSITKIGITKAFASRHGLGVLPTEDSRLEISDNNQVSSYWNGAPRYGWFDAVLMRYAQSINQTDELYLSCIDLMSSFSKIYMCNNYTYEGDVDDEFRELFDYFISDGRVIIENIKKSNENISKYLYQCRPIYMEVDGWGKDISGINDINNIPDQCLKYIELIERLVGVKVSLISTGPTRKDKIKVR